MSTPRSPQIPPVIVPRFFADALKALDRNANSTENTPTVNNNDQTLSVNNQNHPSNANTEQNDVPKVEKTEERRRSCCF